ncbi:pyridoxal-phosphate dependent enzyme [Streptomyces sp. S.PNR 29]|uniref:threonine synthase n=1 Tax=Streptomyces sp. S.PNR 29 TaxID=2973805 RepID=UPI0025B0E276|nr:pyridoxal-phosphate dependent enzyme [Streptomyces sp. S.PNR 29]MDN0197608.1 pyridoxal-phosphate dependent enzyme [Streptomyces sp. S.PNR 29]
MSAKFHLACIDCGWSCEPEFRQRCPECRGALESRLDLRNARPRGSDQPELAYLDFLPVVSPDFLDPGLSVRTPCRPAPDLGAAIGLPNLWLKDESRQPTGTTKDRLASVVLAVFRQLGIKEWVASSTGNSSTALARAVLRDQSMRAHFFCGRDFVEDHRVELGDQVSLTVVDGSYSDASRAAQKFAAERQIAWEGGFFNWARREGLKVAYLEAFDAMESEPDVVVQAISSGMGMMAAHKGAQEYLATGRITSMPRFLMVQQDTCAPMAKAWQDGRAQLTDSDVINRPEGLARAILLGDGRASYPYMRAIVRATGGSIVSVSQREMVEARRMLRELEGMEVCYSAAATIAALRVEAKAQRITAGQVVLANLTGRMRDPVPPTS